jgi:hypothetical protein
MAQSGHPRALDQCPLLGGIADIVLNVSMSNWCEVEIEDENENASTDGYLQGLTASGLQHAHELEEASIAVRRAREDQPQGRRKIHSLGIAHIWDQLGAEARQKNRASVACHRMVAGSLLGRDL